MSGRDAALYCLTTPLTPGGLLGLTLPEAQQDQTGAYGCREYSAVYWGRINFSRLDPCQTFLTLQLPSCYRVHRDLGLPERTPAWPRQRRNLQIPRNTVRLSESAPAPIRRRVAQHARAVDS